MHRFKEWWSNYEQRISAWATLAGFAIMIFGMAVPPVAETAREIVYAIALTFVAVGSGITFLLMSVQLGRRAKYAEAMVNVRDAARKIVVESTNQAADHEFRKRAISSVMDDFSRAFTLITGSNCRCCLKVVEIINESFHVSTFCRNTSHEGRDTPHPIEHNTDFSRLFQDKERAWFIANNLPEMAKAGKYNNTAQDWQARYKSTVIWPIRRLIVTGDESGESGDLLGFLCVDSKRKRPFSEEYDYPLGAILTDMLAPFLDQIANSYVEESVIPENETATGGESNGEATPGDTHPIQSKTRTRSREKGN